MKARKREGHLDAHALAGVHLATELWGGEQAAVQVLAPDVLDGTLTFGALHSVVEVASLLTVVHLYSRNGFLESCSITALSPQKKDLYSWNEIPLVGMFAFSKKSKARCLSVHVI